MKENIKDYLFHKKRFLSIDFCEYALETLKKVSGRITTLLVMKQMILNMALDGKEKLSLSLLEMQSQSL